MDIGLGGILQQNAHVLVRLEIGITKGIEVDSDRFARGGTTVRRAIWTRLGEVVGDVWDRGSSLGLLRIIGEASRVAALDKVGSSIRTS